MKFNQSANFFYPETIKDSSGEENAKTKPPLTPDANGVYRISKDTIVRILAPNDVYIRFTNDGTDVAVTDATNGVLIKANIAEQVFGGKAYFLHVSNTVGVNIIEVRGE